MTTTEYIKSLHPEAKRSFLRREKKTYDKYVDLGGEAKAKKRYEGEIKIINGIHPTFKGDMLITEVDRLRMYMDRFPMEGVRFYKDAVDGGMEGAKNAVDNTAKSINEWLDNNKEFVSLRKQFLKSRNPKEQLELQLKMRSFAIEAAEAIRLADRANFERIQKERNKNKN